MIEAKNNAMNDIYESNYFTSHPGIKYKFDIKEYDEYKKNREKLFDSYITNDTKTILDFGCGLGHMLYMLKENYGDRKIMGIDISSEAIIFCQENIHTEVYKYSIDDLFQKGYKCDLIILNDVLEHFSKDEAINLLNKFKLILNKNARLIITVPNMGNPFSQSDYWHDYTHINGFNDSSLKQILQLTEYSVINVLSNMYLENNLKNNIRKPFRNILAYIISILFGWRLSDIYYGTKITGIAKYEG
jgi:cyclopropane fatty-acyl-phospholipid synthase-like methyltransferase